MANQLGDLLTCHTIVCAIATALEAFAWLSWIVRTIPTLGLRVLADLRPRAVLPPTLSSPATAPGQTLTLLGGLIIFVTLPSLRKGPVGSLKERFAVTV